MARGRSQRSRWPVAARRIRVAKEQCDIFCEATVVSCIEGTCEVAEGEPVCNAGSETFCKCSADQSGTQTCKEDGSGFGECVC